MDRCRLEELVPETGNLVEGYLFRSRRKEMIKRLHELGFTVMLWTMAVVDPGGTGL